MLYKECDSSRGFYQLAYQRYQEKRFEEACCLFQALVLLQPFSLSAWKGFAGSLKMLKHWKAARECYLQYRSLAPQEDLSTLLHLADCVLRLGEQKEGLQWLQLLLAEALKQKSPSFSAHAQFMIERWTQSRKEGISL